MNGTMIDDMAFHVKAWSYMVNNVLGAELTEAQVKAEMYGKNEEVLARIFGKERFTPEETHRLSIEKEKRYQAEYLPHLTLIKGLSAFLERAYQHRIPMAIGSAAMPFNIDFVLDNLELRHYFPNIVSADDVAVSKPHPETYLKAADLLNIAPGKCLVFEDAPKGVEAARHAGMKAIAITTLHDPGEFAQYDNIIAFIKDFDDPVIAQLA
ncbi:MAG: HAD family phosphatase [Chitinophagaceae bacterium]|nr:HAD family phosphatase [Chitinophagaceae bacterium]